MSHGPYGDARPTVYSVRPEATSGDGARWHSLAPPYRRGPIGYRNRKSADTLLACFDSPILREPLEIVGNPFITLWITSDSPDPQVFVYLEEIDSTGFVRYISEGQFRPLHRLGLNRRNRKRWSIGNLNSGRYIGSASILSRARYQFFHIQREHIEVRTQPLFPTNRLLK